MFHVHASFSDEETESREYYVAVSRRGFTTSACALPNAKIGGMRDSICVHHAWNTFAENGPDICDIMFMNRDKSTRARADVSARITREMRFNQFNRSIVKCTLSCIEYLTAYDTVCQITYCTSYVSRFHHSRIWNIAFPSLLRKLCNTWTLKAQIVNQTY